MVVVRWTRATRTADECSGIPVFCAQLQVEAGDKFQEPKYPVQHWHGMVLHCIALHCEPARTIKPGSLTLLPCSGKRQAQRLLG